MTQNFEKNSMNYSKIIGFIDMFKNGKEMVFRIKDVSQMQNNTGTRLSGQTPGKGDVIKRLNDILNEPMYSLVNTKDIMQLGLSVIIEIILRNRTEEGMNGKTWFLNPEEAEYNKIAKYRKI